jgi:hypothetical protein
MTWDNLNYTFPARLMLRRQLLGKLSPPPPTPFTTQPRPPNCGSLNHVPYIASLIAHSSLFWLAWAQRTVASSFGFGQLPARWVSCCPGRVLGNQRNYRPSYMTLNQSKRQINATNGAEPEYSRPCGVELRYGIIDITVL